MVSTDYWQAVPQTIDIASPDHPLALESGQTLAPVTLAYETYGTLSPTGDNAILICHALTGDAHVAGYHGDGTNPLDEKPGWWHEMVGPGKPFDTTHYYIVCSNVLGGCKGSTGPSSVNPATGQPYGVSFPMVTIGDMVTAQARLADALGVSQWLCVAGGSLGGFQALDWSIRYPERVRSVIAMATASRVSAQGIAFNAVGRHAVINDPLWQNGSYTTDNPPVKGLATARMMAHITYLSEASLERKFGRRLQVPGTGLQFDFINEFAVESYLAHQGEAFIKRFDANSYLYMTKAMDYFDLAASYGSLTEAFAPVKADTLLVSFNSDWLFPTQESRAIAQALRRAGKPVSFVELDSPLGHDAFLLEVPAMSRIVAPFLDRVRG
jgi:homoserine O-acetyltransferase/O-succinyltransferase